MGPVDELGGVEAAAHGTVRARVVAVAGPAVGVGRRQVSPSTRAMAVARPASWLVSAWWSDCGANSAIRCRWVISESSAMRRGEMRPDRRSPSSCGCRNVIRGHCSARALGARPTSARITELESLPESAVVALARPARGTLSRAQGQTRIGAGACGRAREAGLALNRATWEASAENG